MKKYLLLAAVAGCFMGMSNAHALDPNQTTLEVTATVAISKTISATPLLLGKLVIVNNVPTSSDSNYFTMDENGEITAIGGIGFATGTSQLGTISNSSASSLSVDDIQMPTYVALTDGGSRQIDVSLAKFQGTAGVVSIRADRIRPRSAQTWSSGTYSGSVTVTAVEQ